MLSWWIFVVEGTRWTPDDEWCSIKLREGKAPVIPRGEQSGQRAGESRSAAAPAVPGKPDELPRYRANLCRNRTEC